MLHRFDPVLLNMYYQKICSHPTSSCLWSLASIGSFVPSQVLLSFPPYDSAADSPRTLSCLAKGNSCHKIDTIVSSYMLHIICTSPAQIWYFATFESIFFTCHLLPAFFVHSREEWFDSILQWQRQQKFRELSTLILHGKCWWPYQTQAVPELLRSRWPSWQVVQQPEPRWEKSLGHSWSHISEMLSTLH